MKSGKRKAFRRQEIWSTFSLNDPTVCDQYQKIVEQMNEVEFCGEIGYGSGLKSELAEKVRNVTASLCKLSPDAIVPSEDTDYLNSKMIDGWDEVEFLMRLEQVLDISLDTIKLPNFTLGRFFFFVKNPKPLNYGEWVKSVVETLAPIVAKQLKQTSK